MLDTDSQMAPHLLTNQRICDFTLMPYHEPLQSAFTAGRLAQELPLPSRQPLRGSAMLSALPAALLTNPPTVRISSWCTLSHPKARNANYVLCVCVLLVSLTLVRAS